MNRGDETSAPLSGVGAPQQLGSIRENASADSATSPSPPAIPAAVARLVAMAQHLGIDASSEFFLLPLAQQALALASSLPSSSTAEGPAPSSRRDEAPGAAALPRPELQWFRGRVQEERCQFRQAPTPAENSPWLLISEDGATAAGSSASASRPISAASARPAPVHSYFYNFHTHTRAPVERPEHAEELLALEAPLAFFNDGQFVSGEAAHTGGSSGPRPEALTSPRGLRSSGGGGGRGGGGALPELDAMRFTSWFVEHGQKRYVRIIYWMVAEQFEVHILAPGVGAAPTASSAAAAAGSAAGGGAGSISGAGASVDDSTRVYRLKSVRSKHGAASCWDLHLQATLMIFGRATTLLQCDSATRAWVEGGARRLLRVRKLLSARLARYQRTAEPRQSRIPLVEVHLRALMRDVADLKNQLAKHRPGIAERYEL